MFIKEVSFVENRSPHTIMYDSSKGTCTAYVQQEEIKDTLLLFDVNGGFAPYIEYVENVLFSFCVLKTFTFDAEGGAEIVFDFYDLVNVVDLL